MKNIGEFLGGYRILNQLRTYPSSILYVGEDTREKAEPSMLLLFPGMSFPTNDARETLRKQILPGDVRHGARRLPLQNADFEGDSLYLVFPFTQEAQEMLPPYAALLDQTFQATQHLHPGDNQALIDTFLYSIEKTPPAPVENVPAAATLGATLEEKTIPDGFAAGRVASQPPLARAPIRRPKRWQLVTLGIIALVLLILLGSLLRNIIPADGATITIAPVKKTLTKSYDLKVEGRASADPMVIPGHAVSATSIEQSQTVPATGQGTHPARQATGKVVLSQIHLLNNRRTTGLRSSSITSASGVTIVMDSTSITEGGSVTIPAHAKDAGSFGNIGAYDLNGAIDIISTLTNQQTGTGYLSNPEAFTGGSDAADFTFVKQSDIDGVVRTLSAKVQNETKQKAQQQVQAGEKLTQDVKCVPNVNPNHQANQEATDVLVKVKVVCSGVAYTQQEIRDTAVKVYKAEGIDLFGDTYGVVGDVVVNGMDGTFAGDTITVNTDGIWAYQYTPDRQKALKATIAGKTQDDALKILHARKEIRQTSLSTSGLFGVAVPLSADNIKIVVNLPPGLHA